MAQLEIALFELPLSGGTRLLGRLSDPDLVTEVRTRLARRRRAEADRLVGRQPLRVVDDDDGEDQPTT